MRYERASGQLVHSSSGFLAPQSKYNTLPDPRPAFHILAKYSVLFIGKSQLQASHHNCQGRKIKTGKQQLYQSHPITTAADPPIMTAVDTGLQVSQVQDPVLTYCGTVFISHFLAPFC